MTNAGEQVPSASSRRSLLLIILLAFVYCAWIGAHWLPLDMSDKELAATASRVWDFKREIVEHHDIPWWTPYFMSGSSYALARGFGLVPWLFFSTFTDLVTAGKLVALSAVFASAVAMYFCARHFLNNEWAAVLSALAFMLHPEQIVRAAGAEHVSISVFFPFIPLLWVTLSRALESNTFRNTFLCALVAALAGWTDNQQALVNFVFLSAYVLYWLWPQRRRWQPTARTCALLAVLGLALDAPFIVPGLVESKYVKLFADGALLAWQRTYSFKSLLELVDRGGVITTSAADDVAAQLQASGGHPVSPTQADQVQRIFALKASAAEKYMGVIVLAVLAATALCNDRRVNPRALWFFVAAFLTSVMCATGLSSVGSANWATWKALSALGQSGPALLPFIGSAAFLVALYLFKLKTARQIVLACAALLTFVLVPGFKLVSVLPYINTIRAPYVFYDGPGTFWVAILVGFFVTDVLGRERWRRHVPAIVAVVAVLFLIDYWPYQKPMKDNGVPARTLANLRAAYGSLSDDPDWVKTYSVSSRYFHLLGPMYGGKPQTYEAFNNWMAPLGTGLLHAQAVTSLEAHGAFLNLVGARYIVFDKTDPEPTAPAGLLSGYRRMFKVQSEDEDFAVFRNDTAHAYLTGYAGACLYVGGFEATPSLSLALAGRGWPLVCSPVPRPGNYEKTYHEGDAMVLPTDTNTTVTLSDLTLVRERHGLVRARVTAAQPCLAVIAESYYPFWHAEVDGTPAEVLRVSTALMGVELPAGPHEIILRYEPPVVYRLAGVVSLLTFMIGIGLVVWERRWGTAMRTRAKGALRFKGLEDETRRLEHGATPGGP